MLKPRRWFIIRDSSIGIDHSSGGRTFDEGGPRGWRATSARQRITPRIYSITTIVKVAPRGAGRGPSDIRRQTRAPSADLTRFQRQLPSSSELINDGSSSDILSIRRDVFVFPLVRTSSGPWRFNWQTNIVDSRRDVFRLGMSFVLQIRRNKLVTERKEIA